MKIGLAFAGGGVSGSAAIGVIQALEEEGYEITHLAGTSSGSMVASLYAYGLSVADLMRVVPRLNRRYLDFDWKTVVAKVFRVRRYMDGWLKGQRIYRLMEEITKGESLSAMRIPCSIVTSDMRSGELVVFSQEPVPGFRTETDASIALAVQASCSIPVVFQPVRLHDYVLVDGGVLSNCPVRVLRAMGADVVISVDTVTPFANDKMGPMRSAMGIFSQVINLNLREQMKHDHEAADLTLHPHVGPIGAFDFHKVADCVEAGYQYAKAQMEQIRRVAGRVEREG